MQTCMTVSMSDMQYNAQTVIDYVKTKVIAVVKCNGYGVKIENAVRAWYDCGVRFFAVAEPFEAMQIANMRLPDAQILLMSPVADTQTLTELLSENVILTVVSPQNARFYSENCGEYAVRAHLKIDTGMGRFGVRYDDKQTLLDVYKVQGIEYTGIFTHFAVSFEKEYQKTKIQLEKFLSSVDFLIENNIDVGLRHCANSCAAIRFPETRLDAVRIGSALVGRLMCKTSLTLKKVGFIKTRAVDVRILKKGDTTGYAMISKLKKDTKCAVLPLGYRHGFGLTRANDNMRFVDLLRNIYHNLREYKHPLTVNFQGKRLKVVGRIGNQYTLVDVSNLDAKPGDIYTADVNVLMIDDIVERIVE